MYAASFRGRKNLFRVQSQQSFISSDHSLAAFDRFENQWPGRLSTANQLDHNVDLRITHNGPGVG
jgi:hypothetical protein